MIEQDIRREFEARKQQMVAGPAPRSPDRTIPRPFFGRSTKLFCLSVLILNVSLYCFQTAFIVAWHEMLLNDQSLESSDIVNSATPCWLDLSPFSTENSHDCANETKLDTRSQSLLLGGSEDVFGAPFSAYGFCPEGYLCPSYDSGLPLICTSATVHCGNLEHCLALLNTSLTEHVTDTMAASMDAFALASLTCLVCGFLFACLSIYWLVKLWFVDRDEVHSLEESDGKGDEVPGVSPGRVFALLISQSICLMVAGALFLVGGRPTFAQTVELAHAECYNQQVNDTLATILDYQYGVLGTILMAVVLCFLEVGTLLVLTCRNLHRGGAVGVRPCYCRHCEAQGDYSYELERAEMQSPFLPRQPDYESGYECETDDMSEEPSRYDEYRRRRPELRLNFNHRETMLRSVSSVSSPPASRASSAKMMKMGEYDGLGERGSGVGVPEAATVRWKRGVLLGKGGHGKVYLGQDLDSATLMAVKEIEVRQQEGGRNIDTKMEAVEREIGMLRDLSHPNIVRYIGTERIYEYDGRALMYIFCEYVPDGSLTSLIKKMGRIEDNACRLYTHHILQGVAYLHSEQIVHRDLKSDNVLLSVFEGHQICKIADFGAAKSLVGRGLMGFRSINGTPWFMAPEVVKQTGAGFSSDIWSVGCTVVEMMTGRPPFSHLEPMQALFAIGSMKTKPEIPEDISPEGRDFLELCFEIDPTARPSADELLLHPWLDFNRCPSEFALWSNAA